MAKKKNHKSNGHNNGNGRHAVHVEFSHPTAAAVAIAGTFNDWRPDHLWLDATWARFHKIPLEL